MMGGMKKMDINTFSQILVMIAPTISAVIAIVGGIIWFAKTTKKIIIKVINIIKDKQEQQTKDIAIMKTKIASIEKYLMNKKDGK